MIINQNKELHSQLHGKTIMISIFIGIVTKLLFLPIDLWIYFQHNETIRLNEIAIEVFDKKHISISDFHFLYNTPGKLLASFVLAPIIENFIFILAYLLKYLSGGRIYNILINFLIIISITLGAYFNHGAGVTALPGAVLFFVMTIYFLSLIKSNTLKLSYIYTVITHLTFNILAFLFTFVF